MGHSGTFPGVWALFDALACVCSSEAASGELTRKCRANTCATSTPKSKICFFTDGSPCVLPAHPLRRTPRRRSEATPKGVVVPSIPELKSVTPSERCFWNARAREQFGMFGQEVSRSFLEAAEIIRARLLGTPTSKTCHARAPGALRGLAYALSSPPLSGECREVGYQVPGAIHACLEQAALR